MKKSKKKRIKQEERIHIVDGRPCWCKPYIIKDIRDLKENSELNMNLNKGVVI